MRVTLKNSFQYFVLLRECRGQGFTLFHMHQVQGKLMCCEGEFILWQETSLYIIFCLSVTCSDGVNFCLPQGDFTWSSLSGRSVRLMPVPIQSLSELERARLQEVAYTRLHQDYDLGCQITMPKGGSMYGCISVSSRLVGLLLRHTPDSISFARPRRVCDLLTVTNHICDWLRNYALLVCYSWRGFACAATFKCPIK